jgi:dihydroorotase
MGKIFLYRKERRTTMKDTLLTAQNEMKAQALSVLSETIALPKATDSFLILPGFCDVHVHFREPGFSYKETIETGSRAAAAGGYTAVCTMPNLSPPPDCKENLAVQQKAIDETACIRVYPYGTITVGQRGQALSDFASLKDDVIAFSDDGRGVQDEEMMRAAMMEAKRLGKMIVAHCEVNDLLRGGYIHDGAYARAHGHRGICSESEYAQIARDLRLAKEIGCAYHVCHISTKESVDLIRRAKADGVDVTCETAPHYLILCDEDLQEDGRFKMNPPLRAKEDREALIEGIMDGTIDMIATDHAPHSAEEKAKGLANSAFGIVGLESAFALMYTHFVKNGKMTIEHLCRLLCDNPRKRFGIPQGNDYTVFDIQHPFKVDPDTFQSMGKSTPFAGDTLYGKCILTVCDGKTVYSIS